VSLVFFYVTYLIFTFWLVVDKKGVMNPKACDCDSDTCGRKWRKWFRRRLLWSHLLF